jgi:hypothetical protein
MLPHEAPPGLDQAESDRLSAMMVAAAVEARQDEQRRHDVGQHVHGDPGSRAAQRAGGPDVLPVVTLMVSRASRRKVAGR